MSGLLYETEGGGKAPLLLADEHGRPRSVTLKVKTKKCGKPGCTECPHGPYAYITWDAGQGRKEVYLGRVFER